MDLMVSQQILAEFLQDLGRAVPSRTPHTYFRYALLSARSDRLIGRATNQEVFLHEEIPAQVNQEGQATVPAKEVAGLVASLDPALMHIFTVDEVLVTLEHPVGQYQFAGIDPADYPEFAEPPQTGGVEVELAALMEGIKLVEFCHAPRGHDQTFLTGILLEVRPGELRLVASDGLRLAYWRHQDSSIDTSFDAILYPEAFQLLRNRNDLTIRIQVQNRMAWFRFEHGWIASRTLDGPYAPYEEVIPQGEGNVLEGTTEDMVRLLRRMEFFAAPPLNRVIFHLGSEVEVEASSQDQGQAKERFSGTYTGEPMDIAFNHRHLLDTLRNLPTERFRLTFYEPLRPVRIEPIDFSENERLLYLVMPITLE